MEACQTTLNGETDETEQLAAVQKSCCFCIPPRLGIIVLALIKLVTSLGLTIILLETLYLPNVLGILILFSDIVPWLAFVLDMIDIVIALVVIIGVCLKNKRIMKMYYKYSICVFGSLSFMCCLIVFINTVTIIMMLIFLSICFLVFTVQVYLNYLLKSEVLKMESIEQFQL